MIESGSSSSPGACVVDGGVNFAVYAPAATRVELCLFDADDQETRIDLPDQTNGIWHGFVPRLTVGQRYGFRAHGDYSPEHGPRFNRHKLLLDPYARSIAGRFVWSEAVFDYQRSTDLNRLEPSTEDSAPFVPRCVVTAPWTVPATRLGIPAGDRLIYELNVRGFTMRHPALTEQDRGRLTGLGNAAVLAHLQALGVTSVELMPIHAFIDEEFLVARRLRNFWGYNPLCFFAVEPRYLGIQGVAGLKQTVEILHDAGIEVILDVVYNHTAEGGRLGPTLSYRGLANETYYRLQPDERAEYVNDTGCGNTLNTDQPVVRRLIVDSLRYWVEAIGIDGFRFDLATALGRTPDGFDPRHPLFEDIRGDNLLGQVTLIAEPWDVGPGGYRLGAFPGEWAEWNDQYRDAVRRFWLVGTSAAPDLARRVHGSADIFEGGARDPGASVNFITSHDGFTLADLVSFIDRHNEANGEHNRDGHRHNFSANHGIEGPTRDADINRARRRHRLNLLATLLFSQGTPMLLAGDEFGNSQAGNNNAYAQDNETGWLDWRGLARDPKFFHEICRLTRIRRELPLLRQSCYQHTEPTATGWGRVEWFNANGLPIPADEWRVTGALGVLLSRHDEAPSAGPAGIDAEAVAVLFNALARDLPFRLPGIRLDGGWRWHYSSAGGHPPRPTDGRLLLAGFSVACLSFAGTAKRQR